MKKQPEKTAMTRQAIVDAFWETAKLRGLHQVTISEITKRAGLNRGTFYVYFSDVEELLSTAENEIIQDLHENLTAIRRDAISVSDDNLKTISTRTVELFGKYDERLFLLLSKNGDPNFIDRIREEGHHLFQSFVNDAQTNPATEYVIALITSAFTGLLQYWHDAGRRIPLDELAQIAHRTMIFGVQGLDGQLSQKRGQSHE